MPIFVCKDQTFRSVRDRDIYSSSFTALWVDLVPVSLLVNITAKNIKDNGGLPQLQWAEDHVTKHKLCCSILYNGPQLHLQCLIMMQNWLRITITALALLRYSSCSCSCSPDASWIVFVWAAGRRSWLRNRPSCSSAISVLTRRDRKPGFISGKLISPDSNRLRDTSARQMSYIGDRVRQMHSIPSFCRWQWK